MLCSALADTAAMGRVSQRPSGTSAAFPMALIRANWPKRWTTVAAQIGGASESGAGLYRLQTTLESRRARGRLRR